MTLYHMACEQLLLAFAKGENNGGSIEWEDLEIAMGYARDAMPGKYEAILKDLEQCDDSYAKAN